MSKDLRPVHTAVNANDAEAQMGVFAERWGTKYPAAVRLWRPAWTENIGGPGLRRVEPADHLHHQRDLGVRLLSSARLREWG